MIMKPMGALLVLAAGTAMAAEVDGLVTKAARYPVVQAAQQFERTLRSAGVTTFATIDHRAAAEKAGLRMPEAVVVVFGNPKGGTPMMLNAPTLAIDLPMKVLIWEDKAGKAWVSYNTASYLAARHGLQGMDPQVEALNAALGKLTAGIVE
jgi:uncharacterized protein (DUF302 family)